MDPRAPLARGGRAAPCGAAPARGRCGRRTRLGDAGGRRSLFAGARARDGPRDADDDPAAPRHGAEGARRGPRGRGRARRPSSRSSRGRAARRSPLRRARGDLVRAPRGGARLRRGGARVRGGARRRPTGARRRSRSSATRSRCAETRATSSARWRSATRRSRRGRREPGATSMPTICTSRPDVEVLDGRLPRRRGVRRTGARGGGEVQSVHALLRGGGIDAMASVGLGEHEAALAKLDAIMAIAAELGEGGRVPPELPVGDLPRGRRPRRCARRERGRARGVARPLLRHAASLRALRSPPDRTARRGRRPCPGRLAGALGGRLRGDRLDALADPRPAGGRARRRSRSTRSRRRSPPNGRRRRWRSPRAPGGGSTRRWPARTSAARSSALGRPADGLRELRSAVEIADALVNPVGGGSPVRRSRTACGRRATRRPPPRRRARRGRS